jgi:hypothetical protein
MVSNDSPSVANRLALIRSVMLELTMVNLVARQTSPTVGADCMGTGLLPIEQIAGI